MHRAPHSGARLIDGKAIAFKALQEIRGAVGALVASGFRPPSLAVVLVGADPGARRFAHRKREACEQAGMHFQLHDLPEDSSEANVLTLIDRLNRDDAIDGILLQYPLPARLHPRPLLAAIDRVKDIDNSYRCTSKAVVDLLAHTGVAIRGLNALVVGDSEFLGRPIALELSQLGARTTVCAAATPNLQAQVEAAELLVATVGQPFMVRGEWIRPGAIVIDAGLNRTSDGKLVGDIDFAGAVARAAWITPVPGGVGSMTLAILLRHTLEASERRQRPQKRS